MGRRTPISKLRGSRSFRRSLGRKVPRSITLIVCEGETEQEYFDATRIWYGLKTTEVIIADNTGGSAPISVVEFAERRASEPGGYDQIYCVFDRNGHESFHRARERIRALAGRTRKPLPIEEAISIPCFELWVLLHFRRTDAPFDSCADVVQEVCNHMPGYKKADAGIAAALVEDLDTALANAEWLDGRAAANDYNPYTSVHRVVRHLAAVGEKETTP